MVPGYFVMSLTVLLVSCSASFEEKFSYITSPTETTSPRTADSGVPIAPSRNPPGNRYLVLLKSFYTLLRQCRKKIDTERSYEVSVYSLTLCLRQKFLSTLDDMVTADNVPVNQYLTLVKDTNLQSREDWDVREADRVECFLTQVYNRLLKILNTHNFRINVGTSTVEGRRRHYKKAFPMMVAGFMMMSSFLVPLGFQFMAMIGGKALLLSKIAFLMASYGGLKRMYGDVHHHHPPEAHSGWHRRHAGGTLLPGAA